MKKLYIWGIGNGIHKVLESLNFSKVDIIALVDENESKVGNVVEGIPLITPNAMNMDIDYIIIAAMRVQTINEIKRCLYLMGYDENKILCFYDINDFNFNNDIDFVNQTYRISVLLDRKFEKELFKIRNYEYEIADKIRKNEYQFPIIRSAKECLKKTKQEKLSLCRFGDGEFEIIFQRKRPCFQLPSESLSSRLKDILTNKDNNILTAIANNYGSLEEYTDSAANAIRKYLSPAVRKEHMQIIDLDKEYYDAYVSRPYIIYKNKEKATETFRLWKEIWAERDVVIIEGEYTRNGVKNDLFQNARKIKRILCSTNEVWDDYEKIYSYVAENIPKNQLILITLGPTATVLAYDLAKLGYQAIDIGQVDNEYEWYLRNVEKRVNIEYKYVAEAGITGRKVEEIEDQTYLSQILKQIK